MCLCVFLRMHTHDFPIPLRHMHASVRMLQEPEVDSRQIIQAVVDVLTDVDNRFIVVSRRSPHDHTVQGYCTAFVPGTFEMVVNRYTYDYFEGNNNFDNYCY